MTTLTTTTRPIWGVTDTIRRARLDRGEIAGSLGDLGTFLPLLLGMASQNGLDFAALFFAGLFNVVTGLTSAIPMAVQPMKSIAAVALTEGLTAQQIVAAGAVVGGIILILGVTGLVDWLNRVVPRSVVRGLQLALGLSLLMKGLRMVAGTHRLIGADSYATGVLAALVVLGLFSSRRIPAALILFGAGIALSIAVDPEVLGKLGLGLTLPMWSPPARSDFISAFPHAALPQIPLTTLNSGIAVSALAGDLFPGCSVAPRGDFGRPDESDRRTVRRDADVPWCRRSGRAVSVRGAEVWLDPLPRHRQDHFGRALRHVADGIMSRVSGQHPGHHARIQRDRAGPGHSRPDTAQRCIRDAVDGGSLHGVGGDRPGFRDRPGPGAVPPTGPDADRGGGNAGAGTLVGWSSSMTSAPLGALDDRWKPVPCAASCAITHPPGSGGCVIGALVASPRHRESQ
jgi:hypothetical protein